MKVFRVNFKGWYFTTVKADSVHEVIKILDIHHSDFDIDMIHEYRIAEMVFDKNGIIEK